VLSTVPWTSVNTVSAGGNTYSGTQIEFAANGSATGTLVDGGLCDSVGSWSGRVVLCQRGTIAFVDKVRNAESGGAVATVIYNNVSGGFSGTLGEGNTSNRPAIGISMEDGQALVAGALGTSASVTSNPPTAGNGYEAWDGTSMATPHVSGVAALVWSYNTSWTNAQVRTALESTARDLGAAGRDDSFGHGLVQAADALAFLQNGGPMCLANGAACANNSECCSNNCGGPRNRKTCR
jgi:subtilisin family serine protease